MANKIYLDSLLLRIYFQKSYKNYIKVTSKYTSGLQTGIEQKFDWHQNMLTQILNLG